MLRRRIGFTLIELLVVIAIIAILAAILFPVFAQAREKARQTACLSNQKQIGFAINMYAQDYDEILPAVGWYGVCGPPGDTNPNDATDQYWSGMAAWPIASAPYIKNWQIFACPSDPDKGGWGKLGSTCYEQQLLSVKMPNSYPGMAPVPDALAKSFPLSYAANYHLDKFYLSRGLAVDMYNLAGIHQPANVFFATDVGSYVANGNAFAGWYIIPGYGNSSDPTQRWPKGRRHAGGRNWTFCDSHVKWHKDPDFLNPDGSPKSNTQLRADYRLAGIYTDPEWDSDQSSSLQILFGTTKSRPAAGTATRLFLWLSSTYLPNDLEDLSRRFNCFGGQGRFLHV